MAGYKLTRSSPGCKIKRYGLNHIEEMHPAVDQDRAAYTKILRAPGSAPLSLLHSCPGEVRMIPSRGGPAPSIHVFAPRAQPRRGTAHHRRPAPPKTCGGTDEQRRDLAGNRNDAPPHTAPQATLVWRVPEGPEGTGGLRDRPLRAAGSRVAISRAARPIKSGHTAPGTPAAPKAGTTPQTVVLISYLVPLFFP